MLSRTSEYALRALIHLTQYEEDWPLPAREIADQAGIPAKYLSKVMGDLVRVGVLESARGVGGGFRLARSAKRITLLEVLTPFEQFGQSRCPFGNKECSDDNPCQAHAQWKLVIEAELHFLSRTSLHEVAAEQESHKPPRRGASKGAGKRPKRGAKKPGR